MGSPQLVREKIEQVQTRIMDYYVAFQKITFPRSAKEGTKRLRGYKQTSTLAI